MEETEIVRIVAFNLKQAADRMQQLAAAAETDELRDHLLVLRRQLRKMEETVRAVLQDPPTRRKAKPSVGERPKRRSCG